MAAEAEEAGNDEYRDDHMGAIFQEGFSFSGYERDYLALGQRGRSFLDISGISGLDSLSDGRGAVFADFDNDGDVDIFLVALQRSAHYLFRNNVEQDRGFLRVALEGTVSGRDAYGAVVRVKTSAGIRTKVKSGGSGFLAQHDPRLLFGLAEDRRAEWIEVTWPSGQVQRYDGLGAGASVRLVERSARVAEVEESRFSLVDPLRANEALLATLNLELGGAFPNLRLAPPPTGASGAEDGPHAARASAGTDRRAGPGSPVGDPSSVHQILRPGRRILLNLWATWCVPCRLEMPELQHLFAALAESGVDLVGISIDTDTADRIGPFVESIGVTYPVFHTLDPRVPDLYRDGQVSIPLSVLLNDQGRILQVIGGWSFESAGQFRALAGVER